MEYKAMIYEEDGPIATLTLNRPKTINALNLDMIEELEGVFENLKQNEDVRVLVMCGAGEKGFCSGLDMKETATALFQQSPRTIYVYQSRVSMLYYTMRRIPQPIVVAIHGSAAGAGFSFAMASDVRVIADDARFSAAYINIGLGGADLASSYFLPRLIGTGRANEILFTGDFLSAKEAMDLGFASRMVARPSLMDTAI